MQESTAKNGWSLKEKSSKKTWVCFFIFNKKCIQGTPKEMQIEMQSLDKINV